MLLAWLLVRWRDGIFFFLVFKRFCCVIPGLLIGTPVFHLFNLRLPRYFSQPIPEGSPCSAYAPAQPGL